MSFVCVLINFLPCRRSAQNDNYGYFWSTLGSQLLIHSWTKCTFTFKQSPSFTFMLVYIPANVHIVCIKIRQSKHCWFTCLSLLDFYSFFWPDLSRYKRGCSVGMDTSPISIGSTSGDGFPYWTDQLMCRLNLLCNDFFYMSISRKPFVFQSKESAPLNSVFAS